MTEGGVDVTVERRDEPRTDGGPRDPNTCPTCKSHYRDEELQASLRLCTQCGHHFPMPARERIASLADPDTFEEEAADLRSADPLDFFDLYALGRRRVALGVDAENTTGATRLYERVGMVVSWQDDAYEKILVPAGGRGRV